MKINLSNWKINTAVEEKLRLFFRRRGSSETKAEPAKKVDSEKAVKPVKPDNIEKKGKQTKKADVAILEKETPVINEDTNQTLEAEAPVKVVIPASALKEEPSDEINPQKETETTSEPVPEHIADSFLIKVNQDKSEDGDNGSPLNKKDISQPGQAANPPSTTQAKPQKPIPEPAAKPAEGESKDSLFSNLFGQIAVEEETALDRLIKSLPDISMEEVLNQAEEIKGLMSEWSRNQEK